MLAVVELGSRARIGERKGLAAEEGPALDERHARTPRRGLDGGGDTGKPPAGHHDVRATHGQRPLVVMARMMEPSISVA